MGGAPRRALSSLTALAALGLTVTPALADVIELVNGHEIRGVIQEESGETVVLLVPGLNRMRLPRDRIATIERSEADENALLMGNLHLEQGLLWLAAQHYTEALALGVSPERIAEALLANPTALIIRLQSQSPDEIQQISNLFLHILSAVERSSDVLFLAGRLCEVSGETDRAAAAYAEIDSTWWLSHPMEGQSAGHLYRTLAQRALDEGDFERVQRTLEQMTAMDPTLSAQLRPIYLIRLANHLFQQGEWEAAITLVGENVLPTNPQVARLWLEMVFQELENMPLSGRPLSEIVPIFAIHYARYFPEDADKRLAELYRRLGEAHLARDEYDLARYAFNRHWELVDPDASVRPQVMEATLREEASHLAPDDWENRIRLTVEMVDNELWDAALDQLEILSEAPDTDIRVFATQQRRAIEGDLAQRLYAEAFDRYSNGDFAAALDILTENASYFSSARLIDEINELRRLCERRMHEEGNQRAYEALARFQEGERQFMVGQYEAAIPILEEVIRNYPETPAAQDAAARLSLARQFLALRNPSESGFDAATAMAASGEDLEEARRQEFQSLLDAVDELGEDSEASTPPL
ncbi:hypothetical protein JXA47_11420 [Candidatus Sumerlaeota bacterium]|nr:hypothetical protein [Candidatus Sumerlaeota bacterium]